MDILDFNIRFDPAKNQWLKKIRNICFDDVLPMLENGEWLDVYKNPGYPRQLIYVFEIKDECYALAAVPDMERQELFLKTLYPSRAARKKYLQRREK
jgi:hypothetical protein